MSRGLLLIPLPGNETMAAALARSLGGALGQAEVRRFPDGESYVRLLTEVAGRAVALVCTLDRPDDKLPPLLFAAGAARELGAARVGLVAPYLAYMRQDQRFKPGEAVTSREFARLISTAFDWLATVDPHLHRVRSLAELYALPSAVAQAAPLISDWIKGHVADPMLVGPDSESEQWVAAVASLAGSPWTVLHKQRHGDRSVEISLRREADFTARTPVLIDDIISSGSTMLQALRQVAIRTARAPVCIGVHGIFADGSDERIAAAGARLVTCNTIAHGSNAIDIRAPLAAAISQVIRAH